MTLWLFRKSKNRTFDVNATKIKWWPFGMLRTACSSQFSFRCWCVVVVVVGFFCLSSFCDAVQCKANPSNQIKFPVADTKQRERERCIGREREKKQFVDRTEQKKCGDNTVDGILIIMRANSNTTNNKVRRNFCLTSERRASSIEINLSVASDVCKRTKEFLASAICLA